MSSSSLPIPEELLADILLALKLSLPPANLDAFTPVLRVNSTFHRIAKPLLYRAIRLSPSPSSASSNHATKVADALCSAEPSLASFVRELSVDGPRVGRAFERVVTGVNAAGSAVPFDVLDLKLDDDDKSTLTCDSDGTEDEDFASFVRALQGVRDVRRLVIRKSGYLTKTSTRQAVYQLALCLTSWPSLERVEIAYKASPLPASSAGMFPALEKALVDRYPVSTTTTISTPQSSATFTTLLSTTHSAPVAQQPSRAAFRDPLALALAHSPRLKVVRALTPALWNTFLLDVAANAAIERVELLDSAAEGVETGVVCLCGNLPSRPGPRSRGLSDAAPSPSALARSFPPSPSSSSSPSSSASSSRSGKECKAPVSICQTTTQEVEEAPAAVPVLSTSLFMQQASKHPRLHALILAGRTQLFLNRAPRRCSHTHTLPKHPAPLQSSSSSSSLSALSCTSSSSSLSLPTGRIRAQSALPPATPTGL